MGLGLFSKSGKKISQSRYLAERSYLYFKYPQISSDRSVEFYLPMLENIEISESQKPNIATYDLIGRSGSLYSYLGAKSRDFSLRFNITLPNILDYITNVGLNSQFSNSFRYFYSEREVGIEAWKKRYREDSKYMSLNSSTKQLQDGYYKQAKGRFDSLNPEQGNSFLEAYNGLVEKINSLNSNAIRGNSIDDFLEDLESREGFFFGKNKIKPTPKTAEDAINYLILWINVIRTSTLNNSSNTTLGPPMIYINHGTMYNNIPCICTNYSIRISNSAGYDLTSLTPRQIEISMSLSENRTGSFDEFKPFEFIEGENLAGWECLIQKNTMDPYNSTFGFFDLEGYSISKRKKESS